jgi:hypothetical protein
MRYRIQIEEMLDCWLIAVTTINVFGGSAHHTTKLYTLNQDDIHGSGIPEIVGWLAMTLAESQT